jgi:CRP-like cAMP-binding protein
MELVEIPMDGDKAIKDQERAPASSLKQIRFEPGQVIFDEGQSGEEAYLIRSGQIEVRKGTRGDNPLKLAEIGKGDILGEMALFDGRPRMGSAIALTEVEALCISRKEFQKRVAGMDQVMQGVMRLMVKRVRQMADEFMIRKADVNWGGWDKDA